MSETEEPPKTLKGAKLVNSLEGLITDLECLRDLFSLVIPLVKEQDKAREKKLAELVDQYGEPDPDNPEAKIIRLPDEENKLFIETIQKIARASILFRRNSLGSVIARYEEYMAEQLRGVFELNTSRFKNSEKSILYKDIASLSKGGSPLDVIIAREVDEVMRTSTRDQLKTIDDDFKLGLFDNFKEISQCIEASERRNIFAHTGGQVSRQYIDKCNESKVEWAASKAPDLGSRLSVSAKYFNDTLDLFVVLGVRITHGLIRRTLPEEIYAADKNLNDIGLGAIDKGKHHLAEKIFNFALSIPDKHVTSDEQKKIFIINKCLSLYNQNKKSEMLKILKSIDWSALHPKFIIAVHVLKEEWDSALTKLPAGDLSEKAVSQWPLFRELRKNPKFPETFRKMFGKEFAYITDIKDQAQITPTVPETGSLSRQDGAEQTPPPKNEESNGSK